MKRRTKKIIGFSILGLLVIVVVFAKVKRVSPLSWGMHSKVNQPMFSDEAINGYDPVAYFTGQKAVKGETKIVYKWNGATWYFSSTENLDLFKSDPEKYAPQFGGYCAYAVSKGFTANSDPEAFKIINDRLYLCADQKILTKWLEDGEESIKKSEKNWK